MNFSDMVSTAQGENPYERGYFADDDGSHRMASAFGPRLPLGNTRQEDGFEGHLRERGRRSHLLTATLEKADQGYVKASRLGL